MSANSDYSNPCIMLRADIMVGTPMDTAAAELCRLADRVEVIVTANFNDVEIMAFPRGEAEKLVKEITELLSSDKDVKLASN